MSPSYRQSTKRGKERRGTTLGVRFIEVSVQRKLIITLLFRVNSIHSDSFSGEYELISWRYKHLFLLLLFCFVLFLFLFFFFFNAGCELQLQNKLPTLERGWQLLNHCTYRNLSDLRFTKMFPGITSIRLCERVLKDKTIIKQ